VAIATIKEGPLIADYQLTSHRDPRDLVIRGHTVRINSFRIYTANSDPERPPEKDDGEWVIFFTTAKPLLTLEEAEELQGELTREVGTAGKAALLIRSEPLFAQHVGPAADIFRPPYPDMRMDEYLRIPYLGCDFEAVPNTAGKRHCRAIMPDVDIGAAAIFSYERQRRP
jgi:hypothetical protein